MTALGKYDLKQCKLKWQLVYKGIKKERMKSQRRSQIYWIQEINKLNYLGTI